MNNITQKLNQKKYQILIIFGFVIEFLTFFLSGTLFIKRNWSWVIVLLFGFFVAFIVGKWIEKQAFYSISVIKQIEEKEHD